MSKRFANVVRECLFDLGVTVVYAVLVGILIVGIVASDNSTMSIGHTLLYAMLLPGAVVALLVSEIGLRVFKEWKTPALRPVRLERVQPTREARFE